MLNQFSLIDIEPFSYTRAGQAYLATHEWLSQVILWMFYSAGGPSGIIILRTAMMILTIGLILFIDKKRIWPNSALILLIVSHHLVAFRERPQLFTYAIFAGFLLICFRLIDNENRRNLLLGLLILLQILWVNIHGAAAFVGVAIGGALFLQKLFEFAEKNNLKLIIGKKDWILKKEIKIWSKNKGNKMTKKNSSYFTFT